MTDEQIVLVMQTLGRLDERTERIDREVSGNGQPGLKQRVEDLEAHSNRMKGAAIVAGAVGTSIWGALEYFFHIKKP